MINPQAYVSCKYKCDIETQVLQMIYMKNNQTFVDRADFFQLGNGQMS